jgi:hypothetical protein
MKMWAIIHPDRPTFYLNPHVSGIVNAGHAITVGLSVMGLPETERFRTSSAEIYMISPGPAEVNA